MGRLSPRHAIILAEQLQLNPRSRVFAIRGGSPELQGWDAATVIGARTHNLILGLVGALSKGFDVKSHLIEYPGKPEEAAEAPKTLGEFIHRYVDGGQLDQFMFGKG